MSESGDSHWTPEEGVAVAYDCPDCEFSRVDSSLRHQFKRHLMTEHDYSVGEAERIITTQ
ncbi:hypothetical protein [Halorarius halobius]|uniref:hypothetical protein n=1 Tax=Halorarius halobius TaxID=2962671 RepID=UPI0020CDF73C|nr:hypothetical protein [Halorarius halobius]